MSAAARALLRHLPSLPILHWGKEYSRDTLVSDLLAALIVTIMLIPQSLAYALLAGLPPEGGLYASIAPLVLYALFGLLIGALMTLMSVMGGGGSDPATADAMGALGPMMGVGAIVILPILWGIIGFIGGLIGAFLYNIAAKIGGGVELDLS